MKLSISDIIIGERHRKRMGDLDELADSIKRQGILQPIGITEENQLVFGERRLRACRDILGWTEIDVRIVNVTSIVEGEYDENEMRKNFVLSERVAILNVLIAKRGGDRKSDQVVSGQLDRKAAAKKAGFDSYETANRARQIVEGGVPEVVNAVDSGDIPVSTGAAIAKQSRATQKEIMDIEAEHRVAAISDYLFRPKTKKERAEQEAYFKEFGWQDQFRWALGHIVNMPISPEEYVLTIPEKQIRGVDVKIKAAAQWLDKFAKLWRNRDERIIDIDTASGS